MMNLALISDAFESLITPPRAAGINTSHATVSTSADPIRSSAFTASSVLCSKMLLISMPFLSTIPPETSEIAMTFIPNS